jgi:hypothetical protein
MSEILTVKNVIKANKQQIKDLIKSWISEKDKRSEYIKKLRILKEKVKFEYHHFLCRDISCTILVTDEEVTFSQEGRNSRYDLLKNHLCMKISNTETI